MNSKHQTGVIQSTYFSDGTLLGRPAIDVLVLNFTKAEFQGVDYIEIQVDGQRVTVFLNPAK